MNRTLRRSNLFSRSLTLSSTLLLPKEVFSMAHVDHIVLSSNLLEVQGDELWLVALDSL